MSTDIKDITDTVEEVAFGAAETAAQVAGDPIGSVRRQVKGLERKGRPAARKVNRRVNARINAVAEPAKDAIKSVSDMAQKFVADLAPEKVVMGGLHQMKVQAKRPDAVGDVAKRTLKIFNRSFRTVARVATKLENASEIGPRTAAPAARPAPIRRPARRPRRRAA